jgi:diadenosine hexaphosphate hydrolase (ATP-forming)
VLSAGGVIFDDRGRVFVLRRADEGGWCFPKGHVEPGETRQEAAAREIKEECGLDVEVGRRVGEAHYTFFARHEDRNNEKTVVYFLARLIGGVPKLEDRFNAWRWMPPGLALKVLPYRNDQTILRAALKVRRATGRR